MGPSGVIHHGIQNARAPERKDDGHTNETARTRRRASLRRAVGRTGQTRLRGGPRERRCQLRVAARLSPGRLLKVMIGLRQRSIRSPSCRWGCLIHLDAVLQARGALGRPLRVCPTRPWLADRTAEMMSTPPACRTHVVIYVGGRGGGGKADRASTGSAASTIRACRFRARTSAGVGCPA